MPVEERTAIDLCDLASQVLAIANELPQGRFLWFRGVNCKAFPTLPKIVRDGRTSDEVFERELRLLTRFKQRSLAYWPAGYPQNDWEHLFAMQHFGIPTRLLDWSENLFVAAHFALEPPPRHPPPEVEQAPLHAGDCVPVIWCVDPVEWNRTTAALAGFGDIFVMTTSEGELDSYRPELPQTRKRKKSPIMMYGAHNSDRIVAQRGTFLVWGTDVRSIEEIAVEQAAPIYRFSLQGNWERHSNSLRHLGFTESMVFPELPSLGKELTRSEGWRQ